MRRTENRFRSWSCVRRVRKMLALVRLGDFFMAAHERSSTAIGGSLRRSSASNAGWVAHPLRGDPTRAFVPRGKCLIYNGLLTAIPRIPSGINTRRCRTSGGSGTFVEPQKRPPVDVTI